MTNANWPVITDRMDVTNDPTSAVTTWTTLVDANGKSLVTAFSCHSGRTYELARTDTGTATVAVENTDGRFDPTNTTSPLNSGGKSLLPMRRYNRQAVWNGVTYDVWTGFAERYPQAWVAAGFLGVVALTCVDACSPLSRAPLPSLYQAEVVADGPTAYFPLREASGSTSAGDMSGAGLPPAAPLESKNGPGAFAFGTDGPVAGATALTLTAGGLLTAGDLLPLPPIVSLAGASTMEVWAKFAAAPAVGGDLFLQRDGAYGGYQAGLALSASGIVSAGYSDPYSGGAVISAVSPASIVDNAWHHLVQTVDAARKTLVLYVDGVAVGSDVSATAVAPRYPAATLDLGGTRNLTYLTGTYAHAAVYDSALSAARVLAHYNAGLGYPGDATGTRAGRYLDSVGWPAAARDIDTGASTVGDYSVDGTKVAQALGDLAEWEGGNLFIAPDGKVTFRQRSARFNAASQATFGDGPGELPYEDVAFDFDNTLIYNDVTLDRTGGATVHVEDATSQAHYFGASPLSQTIGVDTDAQATDRANFLLGAYKDPHLRVEAITIRPSSNTALWPHALGRKIGDRITVKRHTGSAPDISADFFIESIDHNAPGDGTWTTTWQLSPAGSGVSDFFVYEDATFGYIEGAGANVSYPLAY
jgi:hypothetical protein